MPGLLDAIYGGDASQIQDAAQRNALLQSLGGLGVGLLQAAQPSPVRQNPFALGLTGALIGGNQAQRAPLDLAKAVADTQNVQAEAAGRQADLVTKQLAAQRAKWQFDQIAGDLTPNGQAGGQTGGVDVPAYTGVTADGAPVTVPVNQNGHMVVQSTIAPDGTTTPTINPDKTFAVTRPLGPQLYRQFLTGRIAPRTADEYRGYANWLNTAGFDPQLVKSVFEQGGSLEKQYSENGYLPTISGKTMLDPQWEQNKSRVAYEGERATKAAGLGMGLGVAQGSGDITGPMAAAQTQFETAKRYGLQPELHSWVNPQTNEVQTINTTTNDRAGQMLSRMGWIPLPQGQLPPNVEVQKAGSQALATAIGTAGGNTSVGPGLSVGVAPPQPQPQPQPQPPPQQQPQPQMSPQPDQAPQAPQMQPQMQPQPEQAPQAPQTLNDLKMGANRVESDKTVRTQAATQQNEIARQQRTLDIAQSLISDPSFKSGKWQDLSMPARAFFSELGFADNGKLTTQQALESALARLSFQEAPTLNVATVRAQMMPLMQDIQGDIAKSTEANRAALLIGRHMARWDMNRISAINSAPDAVKAESNYIASTPVVTPQFKAALSNTLHPNQFTSPKFDNIHSFNEWVTENRDFLTPAQIQQVKLINRNFGMKNMTGQTVEVK